MKIIRALWGDIDYYKEQILNAVQYDLNEVVYVWGLETFHYLTSLGYNCWLVHKEKFDPSIGSHRNHYCKHKLVALDLGLRQHGEVLFLDWDCFILKRLDDYFYDNLTSGYELRAPLYTYPKDEMEKLKATVTDPFFLGMCRHLPNNSFDFQGNYVIPNAGFIYCRNHAIARKLLSYGDSFECLIEEFALMSYVRELKFTFDDYVHQIEPNFLYGNSHYDPIWIAPQEALNEYLANQIEKNIYIKHN